MINIFQIKRSGLMWFFLAVLCFAQACKTTQDIADSADQSTEFENALLWRIDGNGLENHSYLFGTIHLIEKEKFFWPDGTLSALDASSSVVFEVDLDDMFDISKQMSLLTKAFMNDNHKLSDFYTEEEYAVVKNHFDDLGIPMFFLERIKPMFLTVFASGDFDFGSGLDGQSSMTSYEMEIYDLSKDSNKEVGGLETLEFQISVFDSIPYDAQAKMLLETVEQSSSDNSAIQELVQSYLDQNINELVTQMEEDEGIKEYEDILLFSRNKNWIPIMKEKMNDGTVFFAVGAGHLAGKDGVLDLLQKAGYNLTPLSNKKAI